MKKIIAIVLTLAMLLSFGVSMQGGAVKNLLTVTDETLGKIVESGYIPQAIEEVGLTCFISWVGQPAYKDASGADATSWVKDGAISFDTETKKFGTKSLKIDASKANKSTCLTAGPVLAPGTLEAGKKYTFQAWVKTNKIMTTDMGVSISVEAFTTEHKAVEGYETVHSEAITGTKDWTLLSVTFVMPAGDNVVMSLSGKSWGVMAGIAWFDALVLVEGDKPVTDFESIETTEKVFGDKPVDPTPAIDPTKVPDPVVDEPSAWAKEEVAKAVEAKLVPEHINSKFTSNITRTDFCDLIINMITTKTGKAIADVIAEYADKKDGITFPDTTSENVLAAAALGIVNGRSSGAFDPDASITRQEAAKMLTLAAKVLGADTTASDVEFADAADIFAWAKEFINYVNSIDVMKGTNTATPPNFSPTKNYTREQSILTVYRLFNAIGK